MKIIAWSRSLLAALVFFAALNGCARSDKTRYVTVAVDFGPAGRPPLEKRVAVSERGTVFDALRGAFYIATSGR
ncbi:MAG TPA: hypothetical protein VGH50_01600 [Candidatus Binatia bacterium]|jgi:hypothetical protein